MEGVSTIISESSAITIIISHASQDLLSHAVHSLTLSPHVISERYLRVITEASRALLRAGTSESHTDG
eukprot:2809256-Rhodomonas_salina.3